MCYKCRHTLAPMAVVFTLGVALNPVALAAGSSPTDSLAVAHANHDHGAMMAVDETKGQPTHACPMHPDQLGFEGGRCALCNMFLMPMANAAEVDGEHAEHSQTLALDPLPTAPVFESMLDNQEATIKFVCPMHPHIVSDEPGTCPICGMNLEQVNVGGGGEEIHVEVSGGMQQALGLRTEAVKTDTLWRYSKTLGTVEYNQDNIIHTHSRVSGWIEAVGINAVGEWVDKGQLLYQLYSPELITAQDDYLQALDVLNRDSRHGADLKHKARLRLELLGLSAEIIEELERSKQSFYRVPFYAQQSGMVSAMKLRDGMYIQPGTSLVELVDLSQVWVIADVFENEQNWLEVGRPADVTASALGLFELEGRIDYLYPELDPLTRALQVRVVMDNPGGQLRPGTLVDVELFGGPKRGILTIPSEALIQTGRANRVVVQRSDNSFASVEVRLGMMSQGKVEILEGLEVGDKVVVSGQFLLDSEASIQGSLRRLSAPAADPHAGHNH